MSARTTIATGILALGIGCGATLALVDSPAAPSAPATELSTQAAAAGAVRIPRPVAPGLPTPAPADQYESAHVEYDDGYDQDEYLGYEEYDDGYIQNGYDESEGGFDDEFAAGHDPHDVPAELPEGQDEGATLGDYEYHCDVIIETFVTGDRSKAEYVADTEALDMLFEYSAGHDFAVNGVDCFLSGWDLETNEPMMASVLITDQPETDYIHVAAVFWMTSDEFFEHPDRSAAWDRAMGDR